MKKYDAVNWNLDDVCKKSDFDRLLKEMEGEIEVTEKWWEKLEPNMDGKEFEKFLKYDEELGEKFSKVGYLPMLMDSVDQKDSEARLMQTKATDLALKYNQKSRKIGHWLKGLEVEGKMTLDDVNAKRLFSVIPDLEYGLNYARQAAKHTLSQKEEEIIDNKDVNGSGALSDLRGLIETDFVYDLNGKKIKNQGELLKFVHSKNPKLRMGAYKALFSKHKENIEKLFVIYQAVIKDWAFESKLRGYKSPISVTNFGNHVPDEVVETLLKVCRDEGKVFWKYFEFKAKELKQKKLNRFDLYAPMKKMVTKEYDFETSKKMVMESFGHFSERFVNYGQRVFNESHIDSHPKKNKRSGAFCATIGPKVTPYVLLNHTNTLRDVSTLAHELGHAIHSMYAEKHSASSQHANLPLSETASTLGEMILFENLLERESDPKIKKQMLWEKISDSYATILRQNYFVMFENEAHKMVAEGTTAEKLSEVYLNNLKEQFGKSMIVPSIFKYEWLYISHIFETPFYCYAYNFGELLSLSLFSRYKSEGKEFVARIEKILEAGGSKDPTKVLLDVGVDIASSDFWRGGFRIIEGWQKQLESI
jgi:oligoendopeptidase F